MAYKQRKISQFFIKLEPAEGMEQATRRLVQSADAREEWAEKEEARRRAKKATRKALNTHSQQICRARKKEEEIKSGTHGQDGKIKKVTDSNNYHAIAGVLICDLGMETTAIPPGQNNGAR